MAAPTTAPEEDSYIDYETFLSPTFSPHSFANTLITTTNDPLDPSLDLSTPLSRVLFDLQEIDTHIHSLTSSSAVPLLSFTQSTVSTSTSVLSTLTTHLAGLKSAYARLSQAVTARSLTANAVLTASRNLAATTTALRDLSRALVLARQLDVQLPSLSSDAKSLPRIAHTLRDLRSTLALLDPEITLATELDTLIYTPAATLLATKARELIVDAFSADGSPAAASSASSALWLLDKELLIGAVQAGLNAAVSTTLAGWKKCLRQLTLLDAAVGVTVGRCRAVVAVEKGLGEEVVAGVREELDTVGLWASFWRAVARGLEGEVAAVVRSGGSNARILRGARERVRGVLKGAVERGLGEVEEEGGEGMREAVVGLVVGSVNILGRG